MIFNDEGNSGILSGGAAMAITPPPENVIKIVSPMGDPTCWPERERQLRRELV